MVIERRYFKPLMAFAIGLLAIAVVCTGLLLVQSLFAPFNLVKGDSMAPVINEGDAVTVKSVAPESIRAGQLIVIQEPGHPGHSYVRRVVGIEGDDLGLIFTTRASGNPEVGPVEVSYVEVLGVVGTHLPHLGSLLRTINSPDGYIICVAIPGACALVLIFMLALSDKVEKAHRRMGVPISHRPAGAHSRLFL